MMSVVKLVNEEPKIPETVIVDNYQDPKAKRSAPADPIKDIDLIAKVSETFIANGKYRNNLLFILGCNCGLRCGELLSLKWGQLLTADGEVPKKIIFVEEKNSKRDDFGEFIREETHRRVVYINETVKEAIYLYAGSKPVIERDEYVFKSESRSAAYYSARRKNGIGSKEDHLTIGSVNKILKKMFKETLEIVDLNVSTHSMRKTFARQILDNCPPGHYHDTIRFLQMMLGHAKIESTLHYVGITGEEIEKAFMDLDLGKRKGRKNDKTSVKKAEVIDLTKYQTNVKTGAGNNG